MRPLQQLRDYLLKRWGYDWLKQFGAITYAQEAEDILLDRIWEGKTPNSGIYVDVGANHPVRSSNTAWLYRRGWRGVLVEPNPDLIDSLKELRPEDEIANVGVSKEQKSLTFFRFKESRLNTFSTQVSNKIKASGRWQSLDEIQVNCRTLNAIIKDSKLIQKAGYVDILSVDVEGMDLEVIQTFDFEEFPVKAVICENEAQPIKEILKSELHNYLESKGYAFWSKLHRSCIYLSDFDVPIRKTEQFAE